MNILSLFNKPKTIQPDQSLSKPSVDFFTIMKNQSILTKTILSLSSLIDENMIEMAMWVKDIKHRYVYGNKKLRNDLFAGASLTEIIGKTDLELADPNCLDDYCSLVENLLPEDLPNINEFITDKTRICNLTDIITVSFNETCYFVEKVEDKLLYVKKTPMEIGTVGSYIKINNKEYIESILVEMTKNKTAYIIDSSQSYYIIPDQHTDLARTVLNGTKNHIDIR